MAAVASASMSSYFFSAIPAPFNSVALGGGVGLLAATSLFEARRRPAEPMGEVEVLPKAPRSSKGKNAMQLKGKDRQRLLKRFDAVFSELASRRDKDGKAAALESLKPIVFELSSEIKAWRGDARLRVFMLMRELRGCLEDASLTSASLGLLVLILSQGGESAVELAKPMFKERISAMYSDPAFKTEKFLPRMLLMMEGFDEAKVESLAKDAIHLWDEARFRASGDYLGFEELQRYPHRDRLKAMLGHEIALAGLDRDNKALDRAIELYHEVT